MTLLTRLCDLITPLVFILFTNMRKAKGNIFDLLNSSFIRGMILNISDFNLKGTVQENERGYRLKPKYYRS